MANTTNFGWETPDDTDLVKDGAAAIRTLGSAIDTSLVDLKGGTTGQVLSKTTNTDMDFTWVTTDDANAIQNAIVDAKGDLIAASAADTPARLAVSATNNMVLVTDSGESTGLKWSADYTAYTPSWTAAGTAPSLGNGTLSGRYLLVGKLCHVQIFFQAGSTTTFGTGEWRFSLPFASNELNGNASGFCASGYIEDLGVQGYQMLAARKAGGASSFAMFTAVNARVENTAPFTWGTNDFINLQLVYGIA